MFYLTLQRVGVSDQHCTQKPLWFGSLMFSADVSVEINFAVTNQWFLCLFLPSHRTYCNTDEHPEHRYLSQIEAIKLYLNGNEPLLHCAQPTPSANVSLVFKADFMVSFFFFFLLLGDKELIQEVLFDAVVTAPLEAYWTSLVLNKSE